MTTFHTELKAFCCIARCSAFGNPRRHTTLAATQLQKKSKSVTIGIKNFEVWDFLVGADRMLNGAQVFKGTCNFFSFVAFVRRRNIAHPYI